MHTYMYNYESCDSKLWQNSNFGFQGYREPLTLFRMDGGTKKASLTVFPL